MSTRVLFFDINKNYYLSKKKKKKFGTYQELSNNLQELWAAAAATSLENPYC